MTVPSVGPLVAITYKTAMDDPNRIAKSKAAGALFGLTPKKYQSGERDLTGDARRNYPRFMRRLMFYWRASHDFEAQTLGNGRRQAARFKTGEGCPGAQDRGDSASNVG